MRGLPTPLQLPRPRVHHPQRRSAERIQKLETQESEPNRLVLPEFLPLTSAFSTDPHHSHHPSGLAPFRTIRKQKVRPAVGAEG